jgi:hypothetical protein
MRNGARQRSSSAVSSGSGPWSSVGHGPSSTRT